MIILGSKRRLDRETILRASAELVEEKGFENLTLNQLAERLGVKTPSLYNHLSGFDELTTDLAKLAIRRLEETIRNAAVGKSMGDALKAMAIAYRQFAKDNPQMYKAVLKYPVFEDSEIQEAGQAVVRIFYQVLESYRFSEEDIIHITRGFRSALHGFISLEEAGFFKSAPDIEKSYALLVSGLISVLDKQGANK